MSNLIESFKSVYEKLDAGNTHLLSNIYKEDIVFVDPFHEIQGISSLKNYFVALYQNVDSCEFQFGESYEKNQSAMITWNMIFVHAGLSGRPVQVNGCSHICFDEKIYFHRDYFDAGQMIYERIPVMRSVIKLIKRRMNEQ